MTDAVLDDVTDEQIIKAADLCEWHRRWLGHVYEWAGLPMLDFSIMDDNKENYFAAAQAGLDDYEPMKEIFMQVLHKTQKNAGG